jgi:hypothetical protein
VRDFRRFSPAPVLAFARITSDPSLPRFRTFPFHQLDMLLALGNDLDLKWSMIVSQRINLVLVDRMARYLTEIEAVK